MTINMKDCKGFKDIHNSEDILKLSRFKEIREFKDFFDSKFLQRDDLEIIWTRL